MLRRGGGPGRVHYLEPDWTRRGRARARRGGEGAAPAGRRVPATSSCALPLRGQIDSLNVSAAAAALLYGILHRRVDSAP